VKKFFKSIKGKLAIAVGAALVTFGVYSFIMPNIGTEIVQDRDLKKLAIIGDTGIQSDQFKENNFKLKEFMPQDVLLLGDECYDTGCHTQKEFDEMVRPLSNGYSKFWLVRGNHSYYRGNPNDIVEIANKTPDFRMPTGVIFNNACLLLVESSLWEEVTSPKEEVLKDRKNTEKYIEKWLDKCANKLKIVGAHHCIYSKSGSHGGYNTTGYKALYDKYFANKIQYFTCGHNHVIEDNGFHDNVHHFTSGAFAKEDTCESTNCKESGFLTFENGYMHIE